MTSTLPLRLLPLLLGGVVAFSLTAPSKAAEELRIGYVAPTTGIFAQVGKDMVDGFQMYLDDVKGDFGGAKVKFIVEDEQAKPDTAVTRAKKLILQDKVHMLVGGLLAFGRGRRNGRDFSHAARWRHLRGRGALSRRLRVGRAHCSPPSEHAGRGDRRGRPLGGRTRGRRADPDPGIRFCDRRDPPEDGLIGSRFLFARRVRMLAFKPAPSRDRRPSGSFLKRRR